MARRRSHPTKRDYPRTARLGELLREILAEELTAIDDERIDLLTVTGVEVDADLNRAVVFFDTLDGDDAEGDAVAIAVLGEHRGRLKVAIGRQAYVRKVPDLTFRPDPAVRAGEKIDSLLRDLGPAGEVHVPDAYVAGVGIEPSADPSAEPDREP